MATNERISYLEFPARDIPATKAFFEGVFGWDFKDYGGDYTSFHAKGIDGGGFYGSEIAGRRDTGSALVVLYSADLEATQAKIEKAGGTITKAIFTFPGGRRFHFTEPSGNEFAVWGDPKD